MLPGQRSLFASGDIAVDGRAPWDRLVLDEVSWVDRCRTYLLGADALLDVVIGALPWRCGRRYMYDRMVDDPRLSYFAPRAELIPHPVLGQLRDALTARYGVPLGAPAFNYYRDGRDSVAPHRDRELRDVGDALVCVLTLGATRPFRLRPHAATGGPTFDLAPGSGDLLVMGGACQRDWEHGVPKVRAAGPRVSVTWRWTRRST